MAYLFVKMRKASEPDWSDENTTVVKCKVSNSSCEPSNADVRKLMEESGYELHPDGFLAVLTKKTVADWPLHLFAYISMTANGDQKVSMSYVTCGRKAA